MLGSKKIVFVDCNGRECQVEMPAEGTYDNEVNLSVLNKNILFFDPETESRIY